MKKWFKLSGLFLVTTILTAAVIANGTTDTTSKGPLGASPEIIEPLGVVRAGKPLVMLTMARDHTLFYEAYNDTTDIDGDGLLDTRFKPGITYLGLFDSKLCYNYISGSTNNSATSNLFTPAYSADSLGRCANDSSGGWSGNWLNYMTTSRIDALRVVLYGGHREIDTTTTTILRRAYIPQDAHSWGKEYHNVNTDGYNIEDYTTLSLPTANDKRHFFGNLTANHNTNCSTLNTCSNLNPLLRIRTNVGSNKRIWEWASKERPVLHNSLSSGSFPSGTGAEENFTVRVTVCSAGFRTGCKEYPNNGSPIYKPVGLLHEYGESNAMLFGLFTGSYDQHMSGGRLRKVVSSFADEVNVDTGIFKNPAVIVNTINNIRIRGFNQSSNSSEYWKSNPYADSAKAPTEGQLVDWGNPIGEMLYEVTRYFAGKKSATPVFSTGTTHDTAVGLSLAAWDDPYATDSAAKAEHCSRASFLVISGLKPSFDSDQIPGSYFNSNFSGDLTGFSASEFANKITEEEKNITGLRFIGQSGSTYDAAPTAKSVASLAQIRGLAPDDPAKQGSYYSASVAYYAKTTDLRSDLPDAQHIDTFVVALSSPLPKIEVKLPNGRIITVVPFSKTVGGSGVSDTKGNYQPTNQIVDFYVESIANSSAYDIDQNINGGRYYAEFLINYEDVEQGGDHDMDAIAKYTVRANADNTLSINVVPTYQAGGMKQLMGYAISGTNRDGVYLVASDESNPPVYFLSVPPGRDAGYCDRTTWTDALTKECRGLPTIGGTQSNIFTFSPNMSNAAGVILKDPLWYAAKYGGFIDRNSNKIPDLQSEWDTDKDGDPDTYFLVQNPTKLRAALRRVFNNIYERSAAAGNIAANSTSFTSETAVYQSVFNSGNWSGDLIAYPITRNGVNFTPYWRAAEKIPSHTDRKIFTRFDNTGVAFTTAMDSEHKAVIDATTDTQNATINFIRGDRNTEIQNGGTLRNRSTGVLGDIINSSPFYLKANNTVFVSSNSGMLHAFNAKTGVERFAYIPSTALPHLKKLTEPSYTHRFFVDGEIVVSQRNQTDNKNLLFGFLGRGGKGFFALDVTNPDAFGASNVLWEVGGSDADMGYVLGRPQIAKVRTGVNTQATVVVFGNGYNSTSNKAALFFYNTDGTLFKKLSTEVGAPDNPNGMATPSLLTDEYGFLTTVYGGDLHGNVWKFDVSDMDKSKWASAIKVGDTAVPLITIRDKEGNVQPITAPVTTFINPLFSDPNFGKRFVFFGTGMYLAPEHTGNKSVQTMYGIIDDGSSTTGRSQLVERTITAEGVFAERGVRTFSNAVENDMNNKRGWYMDWLTAEGGEIGERVINSAELILGFKPVLVVSSIIPLEDPCTPGGKGYINVLNPFSGGSVFTDEDTKGFFDVNNNNLFTDDKLNNEFIDSIDLDVGIPGGCVLIGNRLVCGGSKATLGTVKVNAGESSRRRVSWREIIR
jgi:type IV pilus assembly protein PilY1